MASAITEKGGATMRLIDADAFIAEYCKHCGQRCDLDDECCCTVDDLMKAPTIEAEIPKHGRWIPHNKGQNNWCECSECNTVGSPFWKRCPVCEAKMDGGEKDV